MRISLPTYGFVLLAALFFIPQSSEAAYGQGYYQSTYYAQPSYLANPTGSTVDPSTATMGIGAIRRTVFTTDQKGYVFFRDSSGVCAMATTTNAGVTWTAARTVDNQTDCVGINVWYDRWTPGDNGTNIHISTVDTGSDELWYTRLDTTDDALTTTVNASQAFISPTIETGGGEGAGTLDWNAITKATNGIIYMGVVDNTDSGVIECAGTCETAGNWSETTNPFTNVETQPILFLPQPGGDIMVIRQDITADDIEYQIWDDGGGAWGGSWLDIDAAASDNVTWTAAFSAAVHPQTSVIYLAYAADIAALDGNDDDVRTASYNGSWTAGTAVTTNDSRSISGVGLGLATGPEASIYVAYLAENTDTTVDTFIPFWKISTDGMATWSSEQGPASTTQSKHRDLSLDMSNEFRMSMSMWDDRGASSYRTTFHNLADFFPTSAADYIRLVGNVKFLQNLAVTSVLAKGWGTFVIDHPLKRFTHLLFHSFVESPDVKNLYDGIATLDENGEVAITLPDYFMALNKDFRYQVKPITTAMPNLHVQKEIENNQFKIAGGKAGGRISWQVTGTRHDPLIQANPVIVEVEKGLETIVQKGDLLYEFGRPLFPLEDVFRSFLPH